MNRQQLAKMQYKRVRLRPAARRFDDEGRELEYADDAWLIKEVARDRITLRNPRSDQDVTLGTDHIREYLTDTSGKSDGFLRLKSEILLQGREASVEPLDDRGRSMRAGVGTGSATTEEIDEALRLAKGFVLLEPTPLSATTRGSTSTIEIWPFQTYSLIHKNLVSYNGGAIAGLSPGTMYYLYFVDAEGRGGAPTFQATPIRYLALAGPKRLYLGRIRTPPSGKE